MNICIVKPSSLGDIIHTFPAVRLLRRHHPDANICWVVNSAFTELVEMCPDVDDIIPFRRKRWGSPLRWHELVGFIRELREHRFDLVIDFQGLLRSSLISFFCGAPRRIGFRAAREGASLLYTEKILIPANISHAVEKNLFMVRSALGISDDAAESNFKLHHDAIKHAESLMSVNNIDGRRPILAVAPAARWASKTWPPEFFARVLDDAQKAVPGLNCWLLGTENEKNVGRDVSARCQVAQPQNLMGEANLTTLTELLRRSDVLLTNDSGPMHLAAALGMPTTALFGPTDPDLTGPYGQGHHVFIGNCEVAPCFKRVCPKSARTCADTISIAEVVAAVTDSLKSGQQLRHQRMKELRKAKRRQTA